ncbi:MAG: EAL domain-containing protein [Azonexaceae bacterium]|nr:EAL domain-containing protein [Azonexaceae bacterium]
MDQAALLDIAIAETQGMRDKLSYRPFAIFWLLASLIWSLGTVVMSYHYVDQQARAAYQDAADNATTALNDAYLGLSGNIRDLHATPATVARIESVHRVLEHFARHPVSPALSVGEAQAQISQARVGDLNRELSEIASQKHSMGVIWLISKNGRAVAASNADTPESFVGTDYSDREYFKAAIEGRDGSQFAVGRVSNMPGLFFSAPVKSKEEIVGVVAGKISLDFLTHWANQSNAIITDENGVVISAKDKSLVMKVVPDGAAKAMSRDYLVNRYKRPSLDEISIRPFESGIAQSIAKDFGLDAYGGLVTIGATGKPLLIASKAIDDELINISTVQPVDAVKSLFKDFVFVALIGCLFGGFLISTLTNLVYWYLDRQLASRNRAQRQLVRQMAEIDSLTGVLNSSGIEQRIRKLTQDGDASCLMLIDLDFFRDVNDTLGRERGNDALRQIALRIRAVVPDSGAVIRYGSDEFVVLLSIGSESDAIETAQQILDAIKVPLDVLGEQQVITASIGIAMYPQEGTTSASLLSNADAALHRAKQSGKADYCVYRESFQLAQDKERELAREIRLGIEKGEFEVYYQAQVSTQTHAVTGFEALLRWKHPTKGMVSPGDFIPIAEKYGLIVAMGEATIKKACRQAGLWQSEFGRDITIAVNLPLIHLRRNDLVELVTQELAANDLHGSAIELEITESMVGSDAASVQANIETLKGLGVKFSIDDFGTGYSGLSRLKDFPVDALKIDRSFVEKMVSNQSYFKLVQVIIGLAKVFGLHVIAEGVESPDQFELLTAIGCNSVQGYLMHRPSPVEEATEYLRKSVSCQPSQCKCHLSLAA